jgi:predicted nucleotidyltransferase
MEIQRDFRELLALFNEHKVDYIIVGAYALAFYGAPRYTGDIDILVKPDAVNARRVITALEKFGFGAVGLTATDFTSPDKVIQLGMPPVRVDILTSITRVTWEEVFLGRVEGKYGGIPVAYIGREQFISNKKALGRKKDLADLEALGVE